MAATIHTPAAEQADGFKDGDGPSHISSLPQARNGKSFRKVFQSIRISYRSKHSPKTRSTNRISQHRMSLVPPMHAIRSRASWRPKPREVSHGHGATEQERDIALTLQGQDKPGLVTRLLRRAQSKKNLRAAFPSNSKAEQYATISENDEFEAPEKPKEEKGVGEKEGSTAQNSTAARKSSFRAKKRYSLQERFYSDPKPVPSSAAVERKVVDVYVPKHAATDFSRLAVEPRDIATRYHSFDEERQKGLPAMPSPPRPATSYSNRPEVQHRRTRTDGHERRETAMTVETSDTMSPQDEPSQATKEHNSDHPDVPDTTLLQPPPTPRKSTSPPKRHSFILAADKHDVQEADEVEPSDYQVFVQKAIEEDRQEREQIWRAISHPTGCKMMIDHPDFDISALPQRSGTFGDKSKHDKRTSKRISTTNNKRASYMSTKTTKEERRRSFMPGQPDTLNLASEATHRDYRRRATVSKVLSGYIKPERIGHLQGMY